MNDADVDEISRRLNKSALTHTSGVSYREYRRGLSPRYALLWAQIIGGWVVLILSLVLHSLVSDASTFAGAMLVPILAPVYGFWIAYLQLFLHESAHHNVHPNRRVNDLLTNIFISGPVGMDVARYRPIHFDHHRFLGSPADTEISYFDPLNIRYIVESLLGIKALRVLRRRSKRLARSTAEMTIQGVVVLVCGGLWNAALLWFFVSRGWWPVALAWVVGLAAFFPFFGALRQLLEHRDEFASDEVDYTQEVHGAIHRLFGDGMLASTLGGAGFNRHLLHHWDPQVSCTRLKELERFLRSTQARCYLQEHTTTYPRTFCKLFRLGRH